MVVNNEVKKRYLNLMRTLSRWDRQIYDYTPSQWEALLKEPTGVTRKCLSGTDMKKLIYAGLFRVKPKELTEAQLSLIQKNMGHTKIVMQKNIALRKKAKPYHHEQFTPAMKKAVTPFLVKAVAAGELSFLECMRAESQINKSIRDPNFQIGQKYLGFIIGKLKSRKTQNGNV